MPFSSSGIVQKSTPEMVQKSTQRLLSFHCQGKFLLCKSLGSALQDTGAPQHTWAFAPLLRRMPLLEQRTGMARQNQEVGLDWPIQNYSNAPHMASNHPMQHLPTDRPKGGNYCGFSCSCKAGSVLEATVVEQKQKI